ncbi:MAG: hypothetical protein PHW84_13095 [Methanosarcina sp.]|nr:hypothetical protein [Methanosarcina sp.]
MLRESVLIFFRVEAVIAANLRQTCGKPAANLRQTCGKPGTFHCLPDRFHYIWLHARLAGNNIIYSAAPDAAEDAIQL